MLRLDAQVLLHHGRMFIVGLHRGREYNGGMWRLILTRLPRLLTRRLGGAALGLVLSALAGCTPQSALLSSLIPDGTTSILLSHLQQEEEGNRKRVAEMESRKDWDGLVKLAEENLARDRKNTGWWLVAGYSHTQAGRHQRAIECYREMAELAPDDMAGWELLAQSYRAAGQPQRAAQTLNNALRVRDNVPEIWLVLGQSYDDLGRADLAVGAYRAAVKLNDEFAQAWLGLGRAYARLGRRAEFEQAVKALERLSPPLAKELAAMRPALR
jgi:tetratricopeptide (TPR) repeat protein